jgi:gliding motility-associated-like protein
LGESLELKTNSGYSFWTWFGPQGNIISEGPSVSITAEGLYGLSVMEEKNGILCESYTEFELVHSEAPVIQDILYRNFSDDSNIEIIATGDGVFEYSLDGTNFQLSGFFPKVPGGTYNVTVRDRNGCGEISQVINFLNYPRFFSPNNDGYNDSWNIKGLAGNNEVLISIYDRYGKLLKQLSPGGEGWDGTFNGTHLPSDDYWFRLNLEDGSMYSGHFSIVR